MGFLLLLFIGLTIYYSVKASSKGKDLKSLRNTFESLKKDLDRKSSDLAELKSRLGGAERDLGAQVEGKDELIEILANKYLNDSFKYICSKITAKNHETSVNRLNTVLKFFDKHNIRYKKSDTKEFYQKIDEIHEDALRKEAAKEKQRLIKEQIREEQKAIKERENQIKKLQDEEDKIQKAIEAAMKDKSDEHQAEVAKLKELLEQAHQSTERAKSQAQLTKSGHVYVISNIGTLGENVFKVGMTRRLEPMDRVKELGDASVPFPFDVHMMISCDDAPALEVALHKALHNQRVNKSNLRKEFFNTDIETIAKVVTDNHGEVDYIAEPEALEYAETKLIEEHGETHEFYNGDVDVEKLISFDDGNGENELDEAA